MSISDDQVPKPSNIVHRALDVHRKAVDAELGQIDDWKRTSGVRIYRFFILIAEVMYRTELPRRAAALTYTTILSIFPILAVVTSTASMFYTEEKEQEFMLTIQRTLLPNLEASHLPFGASDSEKEMFQRQQQTIEGLRKLFLDVSAKFRETGGGTGVFGFIGLLVTGGLLYWSIESAINQTWHTSNRGTWAQTITNFITILVLAPIVIGLSLTASTIAVSLLGKEVAEAEMAANPPVVVVEGNESTVVESNVAESTEVEPEPTTPPPPPGVVPADEQAAGQAKEELDEAVSTVVGRPRIMEKIRSVTTRFGFLLPLIPFVINTLILTAAYSFLPRTRVKVWAAFAGAFVAAALWELARYLFFFYVYLSTVNRTLADALGLSVVFLLWVYITWIVLLLGNAVVYVLQTSRDLWSERRTCNELLIDDRLLVAVMILLARRFMGVGGGLTQHEIRARLGLRYEEFEQISKRLLETKYITPLKGDAFQIARPPQQITLRELLALGCNMESLPVTSRKDSKLGVAMRWLQRHHVDLAGDVRLDELVDHPENLDS